MNKIAAMIIGFLSTLFYWIFGNWDNLTNTLVFLMVIDYILAVILSIQNKSQKTATGALNSEIGYKGLISKFVILIVVAIAHRIDTVLSDSDYCRIAVTIGFMLNEVLSIIETIGLMGIKLPTAVTNMVDALRLKSNESDKQIPTEENTHE